MNNPPEQQRVTNDLTPVDECRQLEKLTYYSVTKMSGRVFRAGGTIELAQRCFKGEMFVTLSVHGCRLTVRVAELVLEAFGKPHPPGHAVVEYLDGDPQNLSINNLSWTTSERHDLT